MYVPEPVLMREWIFRLLAVGLGLGAAIVVGEVGLRLTTHSTRLFERHAVLGKRFRAGLDVTHVDKESKQPVRIRTNSLGYRSPEPAPALPAFRVLLLGDSFSAQIQLDEPETVAGMLRRRELCPGRPTVVHNFGVDGLHPGHALKILDGPAKGVEADAIVLQLFMSNDLGELAAGLGGGSDLRFAVVDGDLVEVAGTSGWRRSLNGWLDRNSLLYAWQKEKVKALVGRWRAGGTVLLPEGPSEGRGEGSGDGHAAPSAPAVEVPDDPVALHAAVRAAGIPDWYWVYLPPDRAWENGWRAFYAVLDTIRARAAARGIPLILVQVPNRIEVDAGLYARAGLNAAYPEAAFDFGSAAVRLRSYAAERGVPLVQPHEAFQSGDPEELYFWFGHVTHAGSRLVAEPLAAELARRCTGGGA
jgi:hypothetical protein